MPWWIQPLPSADVWSPLTFHHPALMRLQGRQKYSLPDNGAQRRKKQMRKEAHVKEEIPVHVESPRNAIKGGSRWGRCSKTPEGTSQLQKPRRMSADKQRVLSQDV